MKKTVNKMIPFNPSDIRGLSQLVVAAVKGLTHTVALMHHNISRFPLIWRHPPEKPMKGISGMVYGSIRGITHVVGISLDLALRPMTGMGEERTPSQPTREAWVAALNGVSGDYMAASGNPMAISMQLRLYGHPTTPESAVLAGETTGAAANRLLIMVHGLCMNDLQWQKNGHDHGKAVARDLGYSVAYLQYNTGLHVSENGQAFADRIEQLAKAWPVPLKEISIISHSMGGLVTRSACHYGDARGHAWLKKLKKIVFLGTPHHGTTLERMGNRLEWALGLSPYSAALLRLGSIRSAGITDLRYGSVIHGDWKGIDRFKPSKDRRTPVPLPENVKCYTIAATIGRKDYPYGRFLNTDGLVPLDSALGRHEKPAFNLAFPPSRQWVMHGINHFDLLGHPDVYQKIRAFME